MADNTFSTSGGPGAFAPAALAPSFLLELIQATTVATGAQEV